MKQQGALWSTMEDDRTWLDNPRRRRRKKAKGSSKRRARARSRSRSRRRTRRNIGTVAPLTNPRRKGRKGGFVARRRKGGRRRFRRNPGGFSLGGFSSGGIIRQLQQGVKDALFVKVGEIAAGMASKILPEALQKPGFVTLAVDGVMATLVGTFSAKVLGRDAARFVTAGALARPMGVAITMLTSKMGLSSYAPRLGMIPTLTRGPSFEGPRLSDQVVDGDAVMQGY